ncbi:MAG: hypothetical protein ACKVX7_05455 [Planctomycetota bacterium]
MTRRCFGAFLCVLMSVACSPAPELIDPPPPGCVCARARIDNGWCDVCSVGYVAALEIPSRMFFEVLDAHGHDVDPSRIDCDSCQVALKAEGFCDRHGMGFIRGKAYVARLNYHLARGQVVDPSDIACRTCRENSRSTGWCDSCAVGVVGNVAFTQRSDFEAAAVEYQRLVAALEQLAKCELCAAAQFTGSRCPRCKIAYPR